MEAQGAERRLAAILSADAVGYSRLMADDEDATVRAVRAHHDAMAGLVAQHGGRVVDSPGDNLLAEFRSVVEAVRCAIEIQRDTAERDASLPPGRRMQFRIGVHLGDVLVEDGRIYGDGVNVAARLEGLAEPGGICISEAVQQQVRRRLDLELEDLGDCEVKNLPDPVRTFRVRPGGAVGAPPKQPPRRGWPRARTAALSAGLLPALVAGALWLSWPAPLGWVLDLAGLGALPVEPSLPDEPSVVVLPFDNLSGDPEQQYLADGISEDVTAGLAAIPRILVISRNTAYTYAGSAVNVADVGRELGVRYVVEGSVRAVGDRVRVTAQLVDATRDVHVWSQRYDREIADLLDLQTEITQQILAALDVEIQDAEFERLRRRPTESLSAYEAYVRGVGHVRRMTRHDFAEARTLFERAIGADPRYAAAYAALAMSVAGEGLVHCPYDTSSLTRANDLAERALALDPFEPNAHLAKSSVAFLSGFYDPHPGSRWQAETVAAAERALELAPNSDLGHAYLGGALIASGRPVESIAAFRRALRLSPRPITAMIGMLGHANYLAGRHDVGVEFYERARSSNPQVVGARIMLAGHYASVGRLEEARAAAQEVLSANPACTADAAAAVVPPAFREGWREKLRVAGFPDHAGIRSLAVLPLDNLSGDPQQEYFADGMTEAVIAGLAKIGELRVISRTSVMQYKDVRRPLPQIARELGVDAVVEGSVLRAGDRVRITAQLIDAGRDDHLWSESYERDLVDVLALQFEVAGAIARAVAVEVSPEPARAAHRIDPRAYDAYLRGREWLEISGRTGHQKAADYFQLAIDTDPKWASAWAGLADAHTCSCMWTTPAENVAVSRAAAEKALSLEADNAEGHAALGLVQFVYDWDAEAAEQSLRRATELEPSLVWARLVYGFVLSLTGRVEEAIAQGERIRELDPLAARPLLAIWYEAAGELEKAEVEWQHALAAEPNRESVLRLTGVHHCLRSDRERGLSLLEKARTLEPEDTRVMADLAWCRAENGEAERARELLAELREMAGRTYVDPANVALVHLALGDHAAALDAIERAVEVRALYVPVIRADSRFEPLWSDPRFVEIMRPVTLPFRPPTPASS